MPELRPFLSLKNSYKALSLKILAALGISLVISQINLEYFESYLYDLRVRFKPFITQSENIELIYIKTETLQKMNGFPSALSQEKLLNSLIQSGAQAVVYDFDISEVTGTEDDKNSWEKAILTHKNVFAAGRGLPVKGEEKQLFLKDPFEQISLTPSPKTTDQANFAKDGVTRRMILTYQNQTLLPFTLAQLVSPSLTSVDKVHGLFKFYDTDQAYIDFQPPKSFPSVDYENVGFTAEALGRFKNKIVFIGTDLNLSADDYVLSPFGREVTSMTRIELQANIVQTLIKNSGALRYSDYVAWGFIFLASLLSLNIILNMKPSQGLLILFTTVIGFSLLCALSLWIFNYWMPMAAPLLTIFLCYYFFIPYRLIIENRRSWEYYQKNKLLSQVEELKTNFISMMSHDLKTPIARIQGMTGMILSDSVTLSSTQREAVDTIKQSSDDLLKFINAILNYGRIESEGVQLHLESRDINNLLVEVIRKHEFLAKVKRIQIVTELEPLFPVTVDAELMKQVFSNLLENAIKYSPEDTKIMVSSEESSGESKIVVQVADQGPGIPSDELQNIFMKFFRSKNVKSSPIKGSGLGLYLAKYFTELHRGKIFVESTHGNGSTFTVELPIEQGGSNA